MIHLGTSGKRTRLPRDRRRADRVRPWRRVSRRPQPGGLRLGAPDLHPAARRDEQSRQPLVGRSGGLPEGVRTHLCDRPRRGAGRCQAREAPPRAVPRAGLGGESLSRESVCSGARSQAAATPSSTGPAPPTSTSAAPTSTRRRAASPHGRSSGRSTPSCAPSIGNSPCRSGGCSASMIRPSCSTCARS